MRCTPVPESQNMVFVRMRHTSSGIRLFHRLFFKPLIISGCPSVVPLFTSGDRYGLRLSSPLPRQITARLAIEGFSVFRVLYNNAS